MAEVLLLNPRKRRKAGRKAARRSNPAKVSRAVARRKKNKSRNVAGYYANPRKRRVSRRRKSNPSMRSSIVAMLKPAALGAAGALGNDWLFARVATKLPVSMQTGTARHVAKIGTAFLIGMALEKLKVAKGGTIGEMVSGAMVVGLHDMGRDMINAAAPGTLNEFDSPYGGIGLNGAYPGIGLNEYVPMSEYVPESGVEFDVFAPANGPSAYDA